MIFICRPDHISHKAIVLFFISFLVFGSYYCYDNPGPLQDVLRKKVGLSQFEFGNLYSVYSWPNVILPIVGGYLIDAVVGLRVGSVLFAGFVLLGQLIFAAGGYLELYWLMLVGRFVFGVGGESLAVGQNTYASLWFVGNSLNLVFGLTLSTARLGSTVNFWTVGVIYDYFYEIYEDVNSAIGWTLCAASILCLASFIAAVVLGVLDRRASKILERDEISQEKVQLRDIFQFPLSFWLLCTVCVLYYVTIFPFISFGQEFLVESYGLDKDTANTFIGLPYLISSFGSPIVGFIVDRVGRNLSFVSLSIVMTLTSHILFGYVHIIHPLVGIILIGIAYSTLASSLWPICALLIPSHQLGTAFGLIQSVQNLGLALIGMGVGLILDSLGYIWSETFFNICLVIALICTLIMWKLDSVNNGGYLNLSSKQREEERSLRLESKKATKSWRASVISM
ncbi:Major facilitator superfamily domain-containing protein 1 [Lepeophtheirus salmonis]|uniref:Lysosomal dipeptide transporter MFSD1 n=1 Tax=Lepeophtheirus salmonis TaxID=72036 RepID=A0A7R8CAD6_LEPSM|nr:major facilitator superfamily domain-containing protein 1-like [Lepeophtheirus salmonis]CAB4053954.1 Major facilitator superfamily domain-containing protein 1 [Lepeophtheirus salmonis]CAF2750007.1 Major facilitator superfamily domain-containing protein 1 [Lepeophtheirus salmonis]